MRSFNNSPGHLSCATASRCCWLVIVTRAIDKKSGPLKGPNMSSAKRNTGLHRLPHMVASAFLARNLLSCKDTLPVGGQNIDGLLSITSLSVAKTMPEIHRRAGTLHDSRPATTQTPNVRSSQLAQKAFGAQSSAHETTSTERAGRAGEERERGKETNTKPNGKERGRKRKI